MAGTSGNIESIKKYKKKEDSFYITPSSMPYDEIKKEDIVEINSNGEPYIENPNRHQSGKCI